MNRNISIHSFRSDVLWGSKGNHILRSDDRGKQFKPYAQIPASPLNGRLPLIDRLLRRGIHHILPLSSQQVMVVIKGWFLFLDQGQITHTHKIDRGSRPLRSGICILPDNTIIYGDYWSNPERKPVNLYISRDKGLTWDILWKSEQGHGRHIHLVQPVAGFPDHIYFSTGDHDNEVALYRLHIPTGKVQKIGGDCQAWRMVSLIQHESCLIWGSDCEYEQNHIYRFDINTQQLKQLQGIPGPAYYSARDSQGQLYIATTVEDRKHHKAVILESNDGYNWRISHTFKKDLWPPKLFGYGIIEFIAGQEKFDSLLYNQKGLL